MDRETSTHSFYSHQCLRQATVIVNPDEEGFIQTMRSATAFECRAAISEDGELALWAADSALHSDVDKELLTTENWIGAIITSVHVELTDKRFTKKKLREALRAIPFAKSVGLDKVPIVSEPDLRSTSR